MQFYDSLGLEPKLAPDLEELKKRFYDRSREWHPDRFSRAGELEKQKALDTTALLNDAFRTLRNPVSRAEYFLKESGLEPSKDAPPELLEEVFELNMALEELRDGDESARLQLESAKERFNAMLSEVNTQLDDLFVQFDAARDPQKLKDVRRALDRRRYIANLVRDVEKELNVNV